MRPDVVGPTEVADRFTEITGKKVSRAVVMVWEYRRRDWDKAGRPARRAGQELIPDPTWTVDGGPAWDWADLEPWGVTTKRLTVEDLDRWKAKGLMPQTGRREGARRRADAT